VDVAFLCWQVMGLLCLLIFRIWNIPQLIGENTGAVFLAIILYGLSVIPFNYVMSFLFTESTSAQNSMLLFYIFTGALLLIATIVLGIISSTRAAVFHIRFVCRLIPSYCFGEVIANIIVRESTTAFGSVRSIWDMEVTGYPMIFMVWEAVAYFAIVLIREKVKATPSLMARLLGNPAVDAVNGVDEDADVINEKTRLQSGQGHNEMIKVKGLRKVYKGRLGGGNKIAVQDLWMGIPEGQCFGFLGINGAGKTTTLKMLTGDIIPGSGTATLNGLDILTHQNDVRRLLGYCPQFDALIDTLTAREHLTLFARIKGVPEEIIVDYVEHLIIKLGLQEGIADKPSKGYSGGNKRKLCVGIALIGNPPIVFLSARTTSLHWRPVIRSLRLLLTFVLMVSSVFFLVMSLRLVWIPAVVGSCGI
jgi:ATP-binding cassette subfamily A (ABC1) protein 3